MDEILREIEEEIIYPVFEVSRSRPPELKRIDALFDQIRREKLGSSARLNLLRQLGKEISIFTGVKKVIVGTKKDYFNAMVITNYNNLLPELFKKKITPEESYKYIKSFYVIYGDKMYDQFPSRQLTAILLHEIGHIYQHTSTLGQVLPKLANKSSKITQILASIITLGSGGATASITVPLWAATFALSRTLTFGDHARELDADDFAAKYGYADEMAKAFYKFNKLSGRTERQPNTWLGKVGKFIGKFFTFSTHPSDPDRICGLIEKMKTEYKKQYPKMSKEISTIYADIRC
jgi:hypothetical protein